MTKSYLQITISSYFCKLKQLIKCSLKVIIIDFFSSLQNSGKVFLNLPSYSCILSIP